MDGKRRLSSDGKTPKPANKSTKMAEQKQECSRVKNNSSDLPDNTMVCKLTVIAEAVQNLHEGQRSLQLLFEENYINSETGLCPQLMINLRQCEAISTLNLLSIKMKLTNCHGLLFSV